DRAFVIVQRVRGPRGKIEPEDLDLAREDLLAGLGGFFFEFLQWAERVARFRILAAANGAVTACKPGDGFRPRIVVPVDSCRTAWLQPRPLRPCVALERVTRARRGQVERGLDGRLEVRGGVKTLDLGRGVL